MNQYSASACVVGCRRCVKVKVQSVCLVCRDARRRAEQGKQKQERQSRELNGSESGVVSLAKVKGLKRIGKEVMCKLEEVLTQRGDAIVDPVSSGMHMQVHAAGCAAAVSASTCWWRPIAPATLEPHQDSSCLSKVWNFRPSFQQLVDLSDNENYQIQIQIQRSGVKSVICNAQLGDASSTSNAFLLVRACEGPHHIVGGW